MLKPEIRDNDGDGDLYPGLDGLAGWHSAFIIIILLFIYIFFFLGGGKKSVCRFVCYALKPGVWAVADHEL